MSPFFSLAHLTPTFLFHPLIYQIMKKPSRKNLMLQETFWSLIAITRDNTQDPLEQINLLKRKLNGLTLEEILGFDYWLQHAFRESYRSDWWAAACIALGGCSDDGFEYFRGWVISRGKAVFQAALEDPDVLIFELARLTSWTDAELEEMLSVAWCAFKEKVGVDFSEASLHYDSELLKYAPEATHYPDIQIDWSAQDPESLQKICPRIFAHFYEYPLV